MKVIFLGVVLTRWVLQECFGHLQTVLQSPSGFKIVDFSLNEKYEAQLKISLEWKTLYENEATLRNLAEVRLKLADKKLRGLQFQVNLGRGVTIALGAGLLYAVLAK